MQMRTFPLHHLRLQPRRNQRQRESRSRTGQSRPREALMLGQSFSCRGGLCRKPTLAGVSVFQAVSALVSSDTADCKECRMHSQRGCTKQLYTMHRSRKRTRCCSRCCSCICASFLACQPGTCAAACASVAQSKPLFLAHSRTDMCSACGTRKPCY